MVRKFFPRDKNYLLEQAQLEQQSLLLGRLVKHVIDVHEQANNPLGLCDAVSEQLRGYPVEEVQALDEFYLYLAGVYRYKYASNQLEFLWDGQDHRAKYQREWSRFFEETTRLFCCHPLFVQAVLNLTVFLRQHTHAALASGRMAHFVQQLIQQHFEVRLHKTRGIVEAKAA
ncbi:MAG: hypothetical protein MUC38_11570 [Cyclobacteriaceae bacterium]|nr:hypothetical protein [Cyclobacteriaceae bacterium]